ncbi:hypothetical protein GMES_3908 [Paraglaciecola mesophila KMM 241]|uniref:Uncharacterized protein n=1 Tax=Paraglaciecola mesophila KMM 241 TaxID=1128912 RepID=K6YQA4_9ALTE|nr:hypothetical protein GMES_3908 [Paraglaciecola mesophila KMM 241]
MSKIAWQASSKNSCNSPKLKSSPELRNSPEPINSPELKNSLEQINREGMTAAFALSCHYLKGNNHSYIVAP